VRILSKFELSFFILSKSKLFLIFSLSFIGGVALSSFYYPKIISTFELLVALVLILIILAIFYEKRPVLVFSFSALIFLLGIYLTEIRFDRIESAQNSTGNFSGTVLVSKEPENKNNFQKIVAEDADVKFLMSVPAYPKYSYGDELRVSCSLETPSNEKLDFDYRMYLAKEGIFYLCNRPKVEKLASDRGNPIYSFILKAKNKFNLNMTRLVPAPESGLLSGLLLGGDGLLSKEYQEYFSRTGMTHIVAVSGYNVTIVAEYLMFLGIFLGLWRRQAFWFAIVGIFLFVFMVGFPASAVRAGVMGTLLLWAMKNGRLANSGNAIIFSAVVMLLINPLLLRYDIGFQLSFLATLGIIYFYPFFERGLVKKQKALGLAEILFLTLSAQIFVLPIILFNFGKLSVISPLANLLVLPIIPLTMLLGFLTLVFSFILPPLAVIFSWLTYIPLHYETIIIEYLASLKFAALDFVFPWWEIIIWYMLLTLFIYQHNNKLSSRA
jgi:competence protein ComEC